MSRSLRLLALLPLLTAAGCGTDDESYIAALGDGSEAGNKIYGGSAPTTWYHDATGSIHNRTNGGNISRSPFCSGTLIGSQWFLTAAHCVTSGRNTTQASRVAVQFTNDPGSASSSAFYLADAIYRHGSYNSRTLLNDIALIHLTSVPSGITPVPPLPSASGYALASGDVGDNLNFAGFGYTRTGAYGDKLQVDIDLGGFGCTVSGCPGGYSSATYTSRMLSYSQAGAASGHSDDEGPCSGDSGGPAFFDRGGQIYHAGVTSWGDYNCQVYGVSTRTDYYESWIEGYAGDLNGA